MSTDRTDRAADAAAAALPEELPDGLLRWAALPGPAATLLAARRLLEAGTSGDRVTVGERLHGPDRDQVGRLLGLTWATSTKPVTLGLLRAACARSGVQLPDLLEATGGPLRDLRAEKQATNDEHEHRRVHTRTVLAGALGADELVELVMSRRWLGPARDPHVPTRAESLGRLLAALPASGALLATVAQDVFGDPHALDRDQLLGRAAARIVAAQTAHSLGMVGAAELLKAADSACATAAGWRSAWAGVGVTCDQLSSMVLTLNLPLPAGDPAQALLAVGAAHGEPLWLTARALRRLSLPVGTLTGLVVRVCENPSVVEAAADALGTRCPALLCTYGRPSTAAWALLRALRQGGADFLVSADRDDTGNSIAAELLVQLPEARPWLPQAAGLYEEERLSALLDDLRAGSG